MQFAESEGMNCSLLSQKDKETKDTVAFCITLTAVKLVRKIPTVVVAVAHPGVLDANEIVTRHLAGWTHSLLCR